MPVTCNPANRIEQDSKYELIINLRVARELGIRVPNASPWPKRKAPPRRGERAEVCRPGRSARSLSQ